MMVLMIRAMLHVNCNTTNTFLDDQGSLSDRRSRTRPERVEAAPPKFCAAFPIRIELRPSHRLRPSSGLRPSPFLGRTLRMLGYVRDLVRSPLRTFTGWKEERKKAGRLPASSPVSNTRESMISQNPPLP